MRLPSVTGGLIVSCALISWGVGPAIAAEPNERASNPGKRAIEPVAPILPGEVVAALQAGKFDEAVVALRALSKKADPPTRSYLALVEGTAQRLAGRPDDARKILRAALEATPKGPWSAKLRLELAGVELAAGRADEAETLARVEAIGLLAGDRKDRLAEVYHAFARRLLKPDDPVTPADPKAAYDLLVQARSLAKGEALRATLLFALAKAAQQQKNHAQAITDYQAYLKDYPKGADRWEARFLLGAAQLNANQAVAARMTWVDLAREIQKLDANAPPEAIDVRKRALYQIARTYGIPTPPDDTALNLGVAALRRFLTEYPAHPLAVKAAYQIGQAFLARGKSDDALEAFTRLVKEEGFKAESDEAKHDLADLAMTATFQIGQILQGQTKYDEAIAAWKGYLARYPNGPQSADAQRAVVDTQLLIANLHLTSERYDEARAAWQAFVLANPLDARVPSVLFQIGESFETQKQYDRAIAAWEPLLSRFPASEPAAHARFAIAALTETEKGDPEKAIDEFKKVTLEPWGSQARQRIAVMEARALTVVTPRTFRTGETPHLKITSRNLEKLTFSAYKLNAEAYFRKKHAIGEVESLDIGLVAPDAEWTVDVPKYARYKPVETTYDLAKIEVPGVYVVKVTDEKHLQATTLVVGSDLDAIVKTSRDQLLVFVQDMKTGKGRPNARVLVAQGGTVILEAKTGADGVLLKTWEKPRGAPARAAEAVPVPAVGVEPPPPQGENPPNAPVPPPPVPCAEPAVAPAPAPAPPAPPPAVAAEADPLAPNTALSYLIIDGPNVAGSGLSVPGQIAQGLSPRAFIYTDRPAYRPGQLVALRGVVREVADGQYANVPKAEYKLEVSDARGRQIVSRLVTLSEFGTFHETLPLDSAAPIGTYRVRVYQPGKSDFNGAFEVQSYQLQKMDLAFDLKSTVVFRGETVSGDLIARYQYGAPAAGKAVALRLPDGRIVRGTTDAAGKFHVEFPTEGYSEEQTLRLVAQLPQENVAAVADVHLAVRAFEIEVSTTRDVFLDGESFLAQVKTTDAKGEPTGQTLSAALVKIITQNGRTTEREMSRKQVITDPKTGRGSVSLKADDDQGGSYLIHVMGTDRFKNPVVSDHAVTISGEKDETRLRLLADRQAYKVGENASVTLHSRGRKESTALLTWEADRVLSYRVVQLADGANAVAWAVDGAEFPNFTLTASRMNAQDFDEARLDFRVERDLRVSLKPIKGRVEPGEASEFEVTTEDQLGRPVAAELSVALVDKSLLRQFRDNLPPIGPFFYDQTRTDAFSTSSTNTFQYAPTTIPVSDAVVEEAERATALAANAAERGVVRDQAKSQVMFGAQGGPTDGLMGRLVAQVPAPAAAPMAPAGALGMAGGMGGGMGRTEPFSKRDLNEAEREIAQMRQKLLRRGTALEGSDRDAIVELDEKNADGKGEKPSARFGQNLDLGYLVADASSPRKGKTAAQPRQQFVETAYWNPSVVTGKDGKGRVKFKAPMALSEYRFTARGVTGADTLVGETTSELTVRKDFFVDLKVPAALTEGDRPRFAGTVHHVGVTGTLNVKLSVYAGGRDQVFPKTIEIKTDGIDEVSFDAFEVPDGDDVRLALTAECGAAKDELVVEIPVRPWGVQALASASGTASDDATVFVGLPPGRTYENPEMLVVVSPTLQRLLIELALGRDYYAVHFNGVMTKVNTDTLSGWGRLETCILPPPSNTTADRASDLLALTSALAYLKTTRNASAAPEASRLTDRIRGLVAELTASQREDGGWAWVTGGLSPMSNVRPAPRSDRMTSARVVWALATAAPLGLLTDGNALDKAANYLASEYARLGAGDHETRATLLHALSTRGKASFETANSLNRLRQSLSDAALASLALTFINLERVPLAGEILDILGPRGKIENGPPGSKPRRYWGGSGAAPWGRSSVETTALVALAYAQARPQAPELDGAVDWLLAHRQGFGWQPHKAKGPAVAALGAYYGRGRASEDRYTLAVTVNDEEVYRTQIQGSAEGKAVLVPRKALKVGAANRVRFEIEGRGTFGYAVTLTGFTRDFAPDQSRDNRTAVIDRRVYLAAEPELDGKALPTGFSVAINPSTFENRVSQVTLGGKAKVELDASRVIPNNQPEWERDFLVIEEHLPAGATLIDGSLQTSAVSHTLADGVLTLYFSPDQWPGRTSYEVFGYLPGQYRALPSSIRSAYEPGRAHLGPVGDLRVLGAGESATDPYKPTPDELYARGKAFFDAGKRGAAAPYLEQLVSGYTTRDDVARDAARMLLLASIEDYNARKVVQYFEVVKEKAPELVITFDDLLVIGRAYRDINEYERAYLVWRGVAEASYLEDARIGEELRRRGKTLEGIAFLLDLWREYPDTASIQSDFFGLSQLLARQAGQAITNPAFRRELADAGVTRSELLLQAIRLDQTFLALAPKNPMADEASLALVSDFLELEDYASVVKLSGRFAKLYPKSSFLDSFQFSEALGEFHLAHYDRAVAVAETIAKARYKDANGADQPSPNKWQAVYILGQIFDARRNPARALSYYRDVADRFTDAAAAVKAYTRKDLKIPEITVVRPNAAAAEAVRNKPGVSLTYRNIAEVDVKAYPVDLMRLYLTRRNLDAIAGIDLAGITPLYEETVKLGDGNDYAEKARAVDLPIKKEGAYLVMVRGDDLYASGIVLVSPLELEVLEEADFGRVRVTVRNANTKEFVPKVQVKVIGSNNAGFISGETDLRGVFVAEGINGQAAVVARQGTAQYAFHRGAITLGAVAANKPAAERAGANQVQQSLEQNVKALNLSNESQQIDRLQNRLKGNGGQPGGAAAGGFR